MSGYTFLEDSDLSVCEKIKLYFNRNPAPVSSITTSNPVVNESSSSADSSFLDLDASFQQLLIAKKMEFSDRNKSSASSCRNNDESILDLCSPPANFNDTVLNVTTTTQTTRTELFYSKTPQKNCDKSLISFDDTVMEQSPAAHHQPQKNQKTYRKDSDDDDDEDIDQKSPWRLNMTLPRNDSFLEWERLCESPVSRDYVSMMCRLNEDSNQLINDEEAPSGLWDASICPNDSTFAPPPMERAHKTIGGRRMPSTILEVTETSSSSSTVDSVRSSHSCAKKLDLQPPTKPPPPPRSLLSPQHQRPSAKETIKIAENNLPPKNPQPSSSKYRPSITNMFPKKKEKRFYFFDNAQPQQQQQPQQQRVRHILGQNNSPTPFKWSPTHSPRLSPKAKIVTPTKTPCSSPKHSSSADLSPQPDFNDTLEAVEYFMEKGKQLKQKNASAHKPTTKSSPTVSPVRSMKPASPIMVQNTTPDTIRRQCLVRNMVRSVAAGANTNDGGRIADRDLYWRRSVRRHSADDSFME